MIKGKPQGILLYFYEGGVGIFGFADLANFWFGFSVFVLKNYGFSVLVFRAVCGFSPVMPLVFGFCLQ